MCPCLCGSSGQLVCRTSSHPKSQRSLNPPSSAPAPSVPSSAPRLRVCVRACRALKPLEGFSSCHKCQRLLSRKINEPALTGQMTLSKISSSSFSSCLLSLYHALCLLKGCSLKKASGPGPPPPSFTLQTKAVKNESD